MSPSITTCAELQNIRNNLGGAYYLANDIDCSDTVNWNEGEGFEPIGTNSNKFTGTFDGSGYKITGLYINRGSTDHVGLFGCIDSGSEITNTSVEEVDVNGSSMVGGLVGYNNQGTITNCYSTGSVTGSSSVGGLVGFNYLVSITNCYSTGSVTGSTNVGGLVGGNYGATITNSYWDIYKSGRSTSVGSGPSDGCTGKNDGNSEPNYWYYSTHAPMDNWDFTNIWGIVEGVTYPYMQWQIIIISFLPPSPVNDTVCNWRTFNVTVNQEANVSWYLNGSFLHTNHSVMEANYTLHAQYVGENNVSAVAENANGAAMQTWVWNVTAAPAPTFPCTCGDICVNTSGWWRGGGAFNANATTPIQAAVDNATAGETIYVWNGSYT